MDKTAASAQAVQASEKGAKAPVDGLSGAIRAQRSVQLAARIVDAEIRKERIEAEISALYAGVIDFLEARANSPDLARTPSAMADALGMTPQGANNYLRRLVQAQLADRTPILHAAGGRSYAYRLRPVPVQQSADISAPRTEAEGQIDQDPSADPSPGSGR